MNANELADRLDKISYDCTIEDWRASPVGEAATKLRQQQESIEGLNRDYDLLLAEHKILKNIKKEILKIIKLRVAKHKHDYLLRGKLEYLIRIREDQAIIQFLRKKYGNDKD